MIERKEKQSPAKSREISALTNRYLPGKDPVFLDIETTGLGWRSSHIYMIGLLYAESDVWVMHQYFLRRPFREKEMLEQVSSLLAALGPRLSVHYNGDGFDLPYLRNKYDFYALPCPELFSATADSMDILKEIRPYKSTLGLSSLRQKALEEFLGLAREDEHSGSELISVYQDYLLSGKDALLAPLFLHNHDDLLGMTALLSARAYPSFLNGGFQVEHAVLNDVGLELTLGVDRVFPKALSLTPDHCGIKGLMNNSRDTDRMYADLEENRARIHIPCFRGELKYFYANYRDYYYLPAEDTACHKSVAVYTDPAHREHARASNCYQRVQGSFLPLPPGIREAALVTGASGIYRSAYRSEPAFFKPSASWLADKAVLKRYALSLFRIMTSSG